MKTSVKTGAEKYLDSLKHFGGKSVSHKVDTVYGLAKKALEKLVSLFNVLQVKVFQLLYINVKFKKNKKPSKKNSQISSLTNFTISLDKLPFNNNHAETSMSAANAPAAIDGLFLDFLLKTSDPFFF